jgi:hypothetical protein
LIELDRQFVNGVIAARLDIVEDTFNRRTDLGIVFGTLDSVATALERFGHHYSP